MSSQSFRGRAASLSSIADYANARIQKFRELTTPVEATTWERIKSLYP